MQLTNEIKAKIFGLYIGCEVQVEGEERICTLSSAVDDGNYKVRYWDADGYEFFWCNISKCKLILRQLFSPFCKLSDEEHSKVLSIIHKSSRHYSIVNANSVIEGGFGNNIPLDLCWEIQDYLRSRGYALPYLNIDLFESGIAIKKTNKK